MALAIEGGGAETCTPSSPEVRRRRVWKGFVVCGLFLGERW